MKCVQDKILFLIFTAVSLAVLLSGCSEDPIFSAVEAEVELKDPSVLGTVLTLVSHDGSLYTANGNLYSRTGGIGDWRKVSLPSGASRCSQVATTTEDGTGSMFGLFQNFRLEFSLHSTLHRHRLGTRNRSDKRFCHKKRQRFHILFPRGQHGRFRGRQNNTVCPSYCS